MKYLLFYKPYDVLCSFTDDEAGAERATLKDYIDVPGVYSAGRLDRDSEGLLLLTDDGDLIHKLTHPRYDHPKTYYVQVEGVATREAVGQLRRGVTVKGIKTKRAEVDIIDPPDLPARSKPVRDYHPTTWLKIVLREGKKRQIRHMTAAVGFPTLRLVRVTFGPFALGGLKPGERRYLTEDETRLLRQSVTPTAPKASQRHGERKGKAPNQSSSRSPIQR
jgi:23S rRNA pseudouridine2457 synthase